LPPVAVCGCRLWLPPVAACGCRLLPPVVAACGCRLLPPVVAACCSNFQVLWDFPYPIHANLLKFSSFVGFFTVFDRLDTTKLEFLSNTYFRLFFACECL